MVVRLFWIWISYYIGQRNCGTIRQTKACQAYSDLSFAMINTSIGISVVAGILAGVLVVLTVRLWRSGNLSWIRYKVVGLVDKRLYGACDMMKERCGC
jgi:hypothetical protein